MNNDFDFEEIQKLYEESERREAERQAKLIDDRLPVKDIQITDECVYLTLMDDKIQMVVGGTVIMRSSDGRR